MIVTFKIIIVHLFIQQKLLEFYYALSTQKILKYLFILITFPSTLFQSKNKNIQTFHLPFNIPNYSLTKVHKQYYLTSE